MKILGGNFGVNGSAFISRDQKLVIEGASKGIYDPEEISSVSANVSKEKKFGILGFLVGAIILSIVLGMFLNVVGVLIAIVIAIAGSFYSESKNVVEVKFKDDKAVTLECTPRSVKKLIQFVPN
ncbi:hypothetical protein P8H27_18560 [Pseudomonas sp. sp1636]|uniref:hypothetical protein n=1 Tax=Pseudomonas sp. sp1636 TaxID=3036707 RepID=UPI0025A63722|nr:hypothetical protein [Pseudomonas sp. sp1636]MDM8350881.1 hypothetical protein [Pseudomonas sp. sp1636]